MLVKAVDDFNHVATPFTTCKIFNYALLIILNLKVDFRQVCLFGLLLHLSSFTAEYYKNIEEPLFWSKNILDKATNK